MAKEYIISRKWYRQQDDRATPPGASQRNHVEGIHLVGETVGDKMEGGPLTGKVLERAERNEPRANAMACLFRKHTADKDTRKTYKVTKQHSL